MVLDKDPRVVSRMFDDISPSYDLLNHLLSMWVDVGWRERALSELGLDHGDIVLDIATGTGDMAIAARARTGCSIVGIDISPCMMGLAIDKWQKRFQDRSFDPIVGDATMLPFPDSSFDKAMVAFGIRNMQDIATFLDEVGRILRPDGRVVILELSVPEWAVVREAYIAYLTRVMPFIGGLRSGNRAAYDYLNESIQKLPSPASLERLFMDHGFEVTRSTALTMGISHLYVLVNKAR